MPDINPSHLILLDRDGVINEDSDAYIKHPDEWQAIPGSLETISKLNRHDIKVIIVSNQSGLGRGLFDKNTLDAIHQKMHLQLAVLGGHITDIFYCPHKPDEDCVCRKPKTGMLDAIENKYGISLKNVPFIGDTDKDIALANVKGCLPILVKTGKGQSYFENNKALLSKTLVFDNLQQAGDYLLTQHFKTNPAN